MFLTVGHTTRYERTLIINVFNSSRNQIAGAIACIRRAIKYFEGAQLIAITSDYVQLDNVEMI